VQLLDFGLFCGLIHASQPVRDSCLSGQCFASGFLQTPPHGDALASGCILPTAGRIRDFHPLERAPAGRTKNRAVCFSGAVCDKLPEPHLTTEEDEPALMYLYFLFHRQFLETL